MKKKKNTRMIFNSNYQPASSKKNFTIDRFYENNLKIFKSAQFKLLLFFGKQNEITPPPEKSFT